MIWIILTGLTGLSVVLFLLNRTRETPPTTGPRLVPGTPEWEDDLDTTVLCQGCGCNHRKIWMGWNSAGLFRCTVCCDTTDPTNERIPT
jgi:hypothetical protein